MRRELLVGAVALLVASVGLIPAGAVASPGWMSFQIEGPTDPEEYSWEVGLAENQALRLVDEQHAEVYYVEDDVTAMTITAESAHDADGATVPTSLSVADGNTITLTVHHRDGNPAAGGAPFAYPVLPGEGWESGSGPIVVTGPRDEQELKEEQERIAREKREALDRERTVNPPPPSRCIVPKLKGKSVKASRRLLAAAKCQIDDVRKLAGVTHRTGKVVRQSPKPGRSLPVWTGVDVTLGA